MCELWGGPWAGRAVLGWAKLKNNRSKDIKGKMQLATKNHDSQLLPVSFALYVPGAAEAGCSHAPHVVVGTQQQSSGSCHGVRVRALKGSLMESAPVVRLHCPPCGLAQVSCVSLLILVLLCLC